jgi:hypothetical protein
MAPSQPLTIRQDTGAQTQTASREAAGGGWQDGAVLGLDDRFGGPLRRREVLVGALGLTALALAGCSEPPPPDVSQLQAQLDRANADSELARAAVAGAGRPVQPALLQVAAERSRHADVLADEISRTLGTLVPATPVAGTSTTTTTTGAAAPARPPGVDEVSAALRESATSAARYAATESGYRAGLLGSIAAACTTAHTVVLPQRSAPS